jgi:hypothetical protein
VKCVDLRCSAPVLSFHNFSQARKTNLLRMEICRLAACYKTGKDSSTDFSK